MLNAAVATLAGPKRRNHAWGGGMAIMHKKLIEFGVEQMWEGALSDDYQLSRAVNRSGFRIYFVPRCLVASPVSYTWRTLFSFARRQYLITRIHAPWLWLAAAGGPGLYLAGWITAMVALAGGIGALSGAMGTLVSMQALRMPTGPLIVLSSTAVFTFSLVFAPKRGP